MVSRTLNGVGTIYLWDGWNIISEISSAATNHYTWGLDLSGTLQGAGGVGGLVAASLNGALVFYCMDGNGNVSDLVNTSGIIVAHYEYDPFGNQIVGTGTFEDSNPWRFSTKYREPETGLLHYELRPYLPPLGMWASRDPMEEGGAGLYAFVKNCPIACVDELGLYTLDDARSSLRNRGITPSIPPTSSSPFLAGYAYNPSSPAQYSDQQVFDEWYRLEKSRGDWWTILPKCPKRICKKDRGFVSPDKSVWANPKTPSSAERNLHPNNKFEWSMRSLPRWEHSNQCTYDSDGILIRQPPGSGTVDYRAAVGVPLSHYKHDVQPIYLANDLDGGCNMPKAIWSYPQIKTVPGLYMWKYYEVRPLYAE
jgi:RHS repeat-associated protein